MAKEWPQTQILDDQKSLMASSSSPPTNTVIMEKTNQQLTTPPPPLKCPRCDSSNTKFCYYNNYSLSQPRHFCKACKRYWTRGGTLRNVPVGGGCRKNKRLKRGGGDGISSTATSAKASSVQQPRVDLSIPSNHINNNNNPLFYGLSTNPLELNFPYSSDNTGFDFQGQMNSNGVGLGLSSSPFSGNFNSLLFGSSSSAFGSTSTMASLLASSFQQQKFNQATNGVLGLMPNYEGTQMPSTGNDPNTNTNPIDQQMNSSDPSSLLWNNTNVGAWFDPSNMDLAA
ncbi:hypothetical protein DH2020_041890 [Rehmannia glutinosa]|uniref:Dof zinc finger protein n=1 Tax=Rehmannia glutinosa TaxID=99300 RepID=A0ABR0UP51_REHGL